VIAPEAGPTRTRSDRRSAGRCQRSTRCRRARVGRSTDS